MDELRAKFDRCRESILAVRADSTADPISSFEDSDAQAGGAKRSSSSEPRDARANDSDVEAA